MEGNTGNMKIFFSALLQESTSCCAKVVSNYTEEAMDEPCFNSYSIFQASSPVTRRIQRWEKGLEEGLEHRIRGGKFAGKLQIIIAAYRGEARNAGLISKKTVGH
jgi:hypothetical protein